MSSTVKLAFNTALWAPTHADWLLAGQCIQMEERKRISEFCFKNDAKLALAARLLIRYALTLCSDMPWSSFNLRRTKKGKPYLNGNSDVTINFNASHQGDFAVVVADCNSTVGVDVMDTRESHGDNHQFFSLMNRQFTGYEWTKIWKPIDPQEQMSMFYRHWCLKESFVKATGDGITFPLLTLSFDVRSPLSADSTAVDTVLYRDGQLCEDWLFEETLLDFNHCVCVAKRVHTPHPLLSQFQMVTFKKIMHNAEILTNCNSAITDSFARCFNKPFKNKK